MIPYVHVKLWRCRAKLNQNSEQNVCCPENDNIQVHNPILIFIPSSLQHLMKDQVAEVFSPRSPFYSIIKTHQLG